MVNQIESFILGDDEFKGFMKIINYCSGMCVDLHIMDRKILQLTDTKTAIIKCDLKNMFQFEGETTFLNIPNVLKNLNGLDKRSPIRFKRLENSLIIKDTITSIIIALGNEKNCENKKMQEAEFNEIIKLGSMFLECDIDKSLCNLVGKYSKLHKQHAVTLSIRSGVAVLGCREFGSQNISSEFKITHKLQEDMVDCKFYLPARIFDIKSAATLRIYFDEKNDHTHFVAISVFNFFINKNISYEIICRSNILKEEEA